MLKKYDNFLNNINKYNKHSDIDSYSLDIHTASDLPINSVRCETAPSNILALFFRISDSISKGFNFCK